MSGSPRLIRTDPSQLAPLGELAVREAQTRRPLARVWIVASSVEVGRLLARSCASHETGTLIGVDAITLPRLARAVLAQRDGSRAVRELARGADQLIVAGLEPKLPGSRAEATPAFVAAVTSALRDLRLSGIENLDVEESDPTLTKHEWRRVGALQRLLGRYSKRLDALELWDEARLYRDAAQLREPLAVDHLVLHAIYDLNGAQREMVASLAQRVDMTWTFPRVDPDAASHRLIEETLLWAESNGFKIEDAEAAPAEVETQVIAPATRRAEPREVARVVLREIRAGRRVGEMAVIYAGGSEQRDQLVADFRKADIPVAGVPRKSGVDTASGRALSAFIRLLDDQGSIHDAIALLIAIAEIAEENESHAITPSRVAHLVRRAGCQKPDGEGWFAKLSELASQLESEAKRSVDTQEPTARLEQTESRGQLAFDFSTDETDASESLREQAAECALLAKFALRALPPFEGLDSEDRGAAEILDALLNTLASFGLGSETMNSANAAIDDVRAAVEQSDSRPSREMLLSAFVDRLTEQLVEDDERVRRAGEGVLMIDINRARGLSVPFAVVCGLSQDALDTGGRADAVLSERTRMKLESATGLWLRSAQRRAEEADVLFDMARSAAHVHVLSWPRADDVSGAIVLPCEPLVRVLEVDGKIDYENVGMHPTITAISEERPMLEEDGEARPLLDEHELAISVVRSRSTPKFATSEIARNFERAVAVQRARFARTLGRFDGILPGYEITDSTLSPSRLERYARCPFSFFMQYALKVDRRRVLSLFEEADRRDVGQIVHRVLQQVLDPLRSKPIDEWPELDKLASHALVALDKSIERARNRGAQGVEILWAANRDQLADTIVQALAEEREFLRHHQLVIQDLEYRVDGSIAIANGREIEVRGRLDRIDVAIDGSRRVITDYKSGKGPNKSIRKQNLLDYGRRLQLPMYAQLVEGHGLPVSIRLVQLGRYDELREHFVDSDELETRRGDVRALVSELSDGMRAGAFPQTPEDRLCKYCDFLDLCGPARQRRAERAEEKDAALAQVRSLRDNEAYR